MKNLEKFLEFNGKRISILLSDGSWWVAVKPVCEALGVDYNRQFQNLKDDEILGQLFAEQQTVAADGKLRKMICLPEMFVYGWLFSIRSEAKGLKEYKLQCYRILYNHFHGALAGRMNALNRRTEIDHEIGTLEEALLASKEYQQIQELKKERNQVGKQLAKLDSDLVAGQLSLAFS